MDLDLLHFLDLVPVCGNLLTTGHKAALSTSSVILKKNYRFQRVLFWGKILGLNEDYFIVQGRGEDEMKDRKFLYSFNCMDWFLVPTVTDSMIGQVKLTARNCFTGDPSHVTLKPTEKEDAVVSRENVTEEMRLAVTVHYIEEEVSVVPRGAFIISPHGLVQTNRSFGGLSDSEARKLNNFMHFRPPKKLKQPSLGMGDWSPAIDFLDVLSDDVPEGMWSLQSERGGRMRVLRSLLWLGLTFYHVPETPQHGYVYIGEGLKNTDLPHML